MCPQVVDFDADGHDDIVTATFEGTAFIVRGSSDGWKQPEYIVDSQDRPLVLSLFYDMKANKYDNAERSPEGVQNAPDHCVSATAFDWDNDGDYDMLLGAKEGRLYLQRNEGSNTEPSFTGYNELLKAGGEDFMVKGGLTAPRPVDWDGDGLTDLVCGSFAGGVYLYRNNGQLNEPAFEAPVELLPVAKNTHDAPVKEPNDGCYVDPIDYDGDGDLDLLVGGYAKWQPQKKELTAAEEARLEVLDAQMNEISTEMQVIMEPIWKKMEELTDPEDQAELMKELQENEDMQRLQEKQMELYQEVQTLRPPMQRVPGVWLYTRR